MTKSTFHTRPLHRRAMLKGAGAALSLPLLEAMLPVGKTAFANELTPQRFMAYYVPNGMHMASWYPTGVGAGSDWALNETMAPLESLKDDILVLSNTANRPGTPDGNGAHAGGTGAFLTATKVRKTAGANVYNGVSIDQLIANHHKGETRFSSLELGLDGGGTAGDCDSGFACAYSRNIAWSGPRTPKPKTISPYLVYERLFNSPFDNLTPEERTQKTSVLDLVKAQTQSLQKKLGARDNQKLDEYFTNVETLEAKLQNISGNECSNIERLDQNLGTTERVDVMADLVALAMQCDLTRVASYMLGNAGSWNTFGFLGIYDQHHELSHHQGSISKHAKLKVINRWEVERFAYLLSKLKTTQDVTGASLLDNTLVFFASEISDGDWHNHDDMPVILAGSMGQKIKTGQHIRFQDERSLGDLFLTIAQQSGIEIESFGDDGK